MKIFIAILSLFCSLNALEYSVIKNGSSDKAVLVIGGIQGNEPGGFYSANLLATEYKITKGELWIVPNLNFNSIVKNSRGERGDMNRKFANIAKDDPDYSAVNSIKSIITDPKVELIVHLHDGSGFYRSTYINELENPKRWGNSAIIDQAKLKGVKFGELEKNAQNIVKAMNANIKNTKHHYHVKNTNTAKKGSVDAEQLNSLTYFAISNGKAAYANEASKELGVNTRIYYHLLALEEYLRLAGVEFERSFELSEEGIKKVMEKEIQVNLFGNKFLLALNEPRARINFVPMPKNERLVYESDNPLLAIVGEQNDVYFGNRFLTKLRPQYFEFSKAAFGAAALVDDKEEIITFGSKVSVKKNIQILPQPNVRVNIIGFEGKGNEAGIKVGKKDFLEAYSMDKAGKIFRVEFYEQEKGKKDKFLGMFLIEFS